VMMCEDARHAAEWIAGRVREGDLVLVKGSRAMKLEVVVERLEREFSPAARRAPVAA